ncbi:MAG: hypothetical protein Q8K70_10060 [Bacteroidota bacterium]|nr:hypothetical protein [Bacteroidota bacterium]
MLNTQLKIQPKYPRFKAPICSVNGKRYKYGFNGQEKDNEIAGEGNNYTAEFWQYDSRLGRRWNKDPKPTPSISNYATFANNPILLSDPNGDTIRLTGSKRHINKMVKILEKRTGNDYEVDSRNNLIQKSAENTITDKKTSGRLSAYVNELAESTNIIELKLVNNRSRSAGFDNYDLATVNVKDFARSPRALQAGMLGHVLMERNLNPDYSNVAGRLTSNFRDYHVAATAFESRIVTEMLNIPYVVRTTDAGYVPVGYFSIYYMYGDYFFKMKGGAMPNGEIDENGRIGIKENLNVIWGIRNKLYRFHRIQ